MSVLYHYYSENMILRINIGVEEIDKLYIHEEIVEEILRKLVKAFSKTSLQMHPIIVDENTNVILDGMHRWSALKNLGYKYIVCAFIDYHNPLIKVKNWYRIYQSISSGKILNIKSLLKSFDIVYGEGKPDFSDKRLVSAIYVKGRYMKIYSNKPMSSPNAYKVVSFIDEYVLKSGGRIKYIPSGQRDWNEEIVLVTPSISKNDVIRSALSRNIYPPKSTRHIIPIRPLYLNIPLKFLSKNFRGNKRLRNKFLNKFLYHKDVYSVLGKTYIDRFYEEDYLYLYF